MAAVDPKSRFSVLGSRLIGWLAAAASIAAAVMMLATVADVFMANVLGRPIVGTFDLVETMLPCLVFLGIPQTFLSEGNITVDLVDHVAGSRTITVLRLLAALAALVFLGLVLWQMLWAARDAYTFGDRKPDLPIPLFVIWIPVLIGTAFALIAAIMLAGHRLRDLRFAKRRSK